MIPPSPIRSPLADGNNLASNEYNRWFQLVADALNAVVPGPFANDAAAKAAGVIIGRPYYQSSGTVVVRLV